MTELPPPRKLIAIIIALVPLLAVGVSMLLYWLIHEPKARQITVTPEQLAAADRSNDSSRANIQWTRIQPGDPNELSSDPNWPQLTLNVLSSTGQPIANAKLWLLQDSREFPSIAKGSRWPSVHATSDQFGAATVSFPNVNKLNVLASAPNCAIVLLRGLVPDQSHKLEIRLSAGHPLA